MRSDNMQPGGWKGEWVHHPGFVPYHLFGIYKYLTNAYRIEGFYMRHAALATS